MLIQTNGEPVVAVMGVTGAGKSHFIAQLTGDMSITGDTLESVTQDVKQYNVEVNGRKMIILDTPGMNDSKRSDVVVLKLIADWVKNCYEQKVKLSGIIYMHDISQQRMAGSSVASLNIFRELCGEDFYKNIVFVPNMWHKTSEEISRRKLDQLRRNDTYWGLMTSRGAVVAEYNGDVKTAHKIVSNILTNCPANPKLGEELDTMGLADTRAGKVANNELEKLVNKHKNELTTLLKNHEIKLAAMHQASTAVKKKIEEDFRLSEIKVQSEIDRLNKDFAEFHATAHQKKHLRTEFVVRMAFASAAAALGGAVAGPAGAALALGVISASFK